jgi:hypothetical protein
MSHPPGHVGERGRGGERQQPAIVDGAPEQPRRHLGPEVMDDGPIQMAAADLTIGCTEGVHGLRVDTHPTGHTIRNWHEQAPGQA